MVELRELVLAQPARLGVLTVLPLVLAATTTVNAAVHDLPLGLPLGFSAVLVAFSIAAFVHIRASFKVSTLESNWLE